MAALRIVCRQILPGLQMLLGEGCSNTKTKGVVLLRTTSINRTLHQSAPFTAATHHCQELGEPYSHPRLYSVPSDDGFIILSTWGCGFGSRRGFWTATHLNSTTLAQSSKISPGDPEETLKDDLPSESDACGQGRGEDGDKKMEDCNRDEENDDDDEEDDDDEPLVAKYDESGKLLSNWTRMKMMMKAYSFVIIPVHWIIAPLWFGSFYYAVKMGVDIAPVLLKMGISEGHVNTLKTSGASNALMAYALYKIFTPLRYTVTVGATEMTIRYLRRRGYIKHAPRKEKTYRQSLKETVQEVKEKIDNRNR